MTEKEYLREIEKRNFIMKTLIEEGHETCIHEISEKGNIPLENVIFTITWETVEMLRIIGQINEEINNLSKTEEKLKIVNRIKEIIGY